VDKLSNLSPEMRRELALSVDSKLSDELAEVQAKIRAIEEKRRDLETLQQSTGDLERSLDALANRKANLDKQKLQSEIRAVQTLIYINREELARRFVASPSVLPHVTDAQLAISGMAYTGYSQGQPRLDRVTYALVPMKAENGAWRGCPAVLQFFGAGFAPTCKIEVEGGGGMNFVNKWSGHYLEICVGSQEFAPLHYLKKRFRVVNPWIHKASEWVEFSWEYNRDELKAKIEAIYEAAVRNLDNGKPQEAYNSLSAILGVIPASGLGEFCDVAAMRAAEQRALSEMQHLPG